MGSFETRTSSVRPKSVTKYKRQKTPQIKGQYPTWQHGHSLKGKQQLESDFNEFNVGFVRRILLVMCCLPIEGSFFCRH